MMTKEVPLNLKPASPEFMVLIEEMIGHNLNFGGPGEYADYFPFIIESVDKENGTAVIRFDGYSIPMR